MKRMLFFLCLYVVSAHGQTENDSLLNVFNNALLHDTVRLQAIHHIATTYAFINHDTALLYFNEELDFATKTNQPQFEAKALGGMGNVYIDKNDFVKALNVSYQSLKISERIGYKAGIAYNFHRIAAAYTYTDSVAKSLPYFQKARKMYEELGNKGNIARTTNCVGSCYLGMNEPQKALECYQEALKLWEAYGDKREIAQSLENIGSVYGVLGDNAQWMKYLNQTLAMQKEIADTPGISITLGHIGDNYFAQKNYTEAQSYYRQSYEAAKTVEIPIYSREAAQRLYQINKALGKHREALQNHELYIQLRDSVSREEVHKKATEIQTRYETEKKEAENKLLKQENELKEAEISNKNRAIYVLIASALLIAALMFAWVTRVRLRKKESDLKNIQQLQKEKERIARDLHDNVGGQLSYIIYSLDGINEEDKEKRTEITESINQSVRSVIGSLRETIWAISDANIKLQDFSDKLKLYARNLFKHTNVIIKFNEDIKTERELNALLGLNLYRICQEILTNAFKHANASEVIIDLKTDEEKLIVKISDNGVGFDMSQKKEESYGLQNARKRSSEFGITLTLATEINKGTKYELIV